MNDPWFSAEPEISCDERGVKRSGGGFPGMARRLFCAEFLLQEFVFVQLLLRHRRLQRVEGPGEVLRTQREDAILRLQTWARETERMRTKG